MISAGVISLSMEAYRVDVHHHILPREYVQALESIGAKESGGSALPEWNNVSLITLGVVTAIVETLLGSRNKKAIAKLLPKRADIAIKQTRLGYYRYLGQKNPSHKSMVSSCRPKSYRRT